MRHPIPLLIAAALVAAVLAPVAASADRMWIGFHDDPVLRFDPNRQTELDVARSNKATVLRTLVTWASVAPEKPTNAADPFDPAYKFDDLDEFVRNAQLRDMEVLITLWGTPKWANGGKTPNYLPTKMADFQNFAKAVASRYSGRNPGYPFVRFYGIWNESNLGLFLAPQYNASGAIVGPAAYAKLAAAGYTGIKAGSSKALVAVGETPRTVATRRRPAPPTRYPPASSRSSSPRRTETQVRRLGTASVPVPREPEADPEGEVAERDARVLPAVRDVTRHVVRSQEHPVDHGVRHGRSPASRGRHGGNKLRL